MGGSPQPSISVTELGCISVSWTSRILPTCALLVAPRRLLAVRESVLTSRRDAVFDMLVQLLTYLLVVGRWASSIPLFQSIGRRTNQVAALSLRINRFLRACPTPSFPPSHAPHLATLAICSRELVCEAADTNRQVDCYVDRVRGEGASWTSTAACLPVWLGSIGCPPATPADKKKIAVLLICR